MKNVQIIIMFLFSLTNSVFGLKTEAEMDTLEFVWHHGYPCETHNVETYDGYLLEMHRIPYGKKSGPAENKPVFFLQHGILCSSFVYVVSGPEKGLAFPLADLGYDVWMGNVRGNTYSRAHRTKNPRRGSFWKFSWHEIGIYDLPAMIDYVLKETNEEKLFYAGHSQGTTSFFVMCSERPKYNSKIRAMFALAPVAFMSNLFSPFVQFTSLFQEPVGCLLKFLGVHEFMPNSELLAFIAEKFCNNDSLSQFLCSSSLFILCGFNVANLNGTLLPNIMAHVPAGSSTMQFLHYAQGIKSGDFRQYDHGVIKNLLLYRSVFPPLYDLKKVTAPVSLHYSHNDWMSSVGDVRQLSLNLPNLIGRFRIKDPRFTHLDYMWGTNAAEVCYQDIFDLAEKY